METKIALPHCKMENIPVIGGFVISRAQKDLARIMEAAPDMDQAFLDALTAKQETVKVLVRPREKTAEMKEVTRGMYAVMDELKPRLNLLDIKLQRAGQQLGKPADAFGLVAIRSHIRSRNAEAVIADMELLLHDLDANMHVLETKGFTAAMREEFVSAANAIFLLNGQQNEKMDERAELTQDNKLTISDYWKGISELMVTGRLLYHDDPVKLKEYTFAVLHRRVGGGNPGSQGGSNDETLGSLSVTATSKSSGLPIEGALLSVLNTSISDYTAADGEAVAEGIAPGKVAFSLAKAGFKTLTQSDIVIKAGKQTEVDMELEEE